MESRGTKSNKQLPSYMAPTIVKMNKYQTQNEIDGKVDLQGQLRQPSKLSKSGSQSAWKPTRATPVELETEKSESKENNLFSDQNQSYREGARGKSRISDHSDGLLNRSASKKSQKQLIDRLHREGAYKQIQKEIFERDRQQKETEGCTFQPNSLGRSKKFSVSLFTKESGRYRTELG